MKGKEREAVINLHLHSGDKGPPEPCLRVGFIVNAKSGAWDQPNKVWHQEGQQC